LLAILRFSTIAFPEKTKYLGAVLMSVAVNTARQSMTETEASPASERWLLWLVAAAVVAPWIVIFIVLPPSEQRFALNDDWAFSKGAFKFAAGGGIDYQGWSSMPLLGQWLWALPWIKLLGPSHVTLRLSTIVLSWFGLWAFYDLLRQQGLSQRIAAFTTVALAWSPYFMLLSGTFMTDVPSLTFSFIALALYSRAIRGGEFGQLFLAAGVAMLAVLTRQNTIMAPIAAAAFLALTPERRIDPTYWLAVLFPVALCLAVHFWLRERPDAVPRPIQLLKPEQYLIFPYALLNWVSFFALPVILVSPRPGSRLRWSIAFAALALPAVVAWSWHFASRAFGFTGPDGAYLSASIFPFVADIWLPETHHIWGFDPPLYLWISLRAALTPVAFLAGAGFIVRLIDYIQSSRQPNILILFTALQVCLLPLSQALYDRYLFALLPGTMLVAASSALRSRPRWIAGLAALVVFGAVSLGITHDWLVTHAATWRLGYRAGDVGAVTMSGQKLKIPPIGLDGGLEWDGFFAPHPSRWRYAGIVTRTRGLNWPFNEACFDHLGGRFAISYSPMSHGRILDREPYSLWLTPGTRFAYLLEWDPSTY
jgi:hypothetical protein